MSYVDAEGMRAEALDELWRERAGQWCCADCGLHVEWAPPLELADYTQPSFGPVFCAFCVGRHIAFREDDVFDALDAQVVGDTAVSGPGRLSYAALVARELLR